jgi:hypothetical protein
MAIERFFAERLELRGELPPLRHARRGLVQAHLEQVEVETAIRRDDDLAIDDASVG